MTSSEEPGEFSSPSEEAPRPRPTFGQPGRITASGGASVPADPVGSSPPGSAMSEASEDEAVEPVAVEPEPGMPLTDGREPAAPLLEGPAVGDQTAAEIRRDEDGVAARPPVTSPPAVPGNLPPVTRFGNVPSPAPPQNAPPAPAAPQEIPIPPGAEGAAVAAIPEETPVPGGSSVPEAGPIRSRPLGPRRLDEVPRTAPATGLAGSDPVEFSAPVEPVPQGSDARPASTPSEAQPGGMWAGRARPRVIAVANQKGGVGKTTTTVNLGAAAAELGHRVLVVDLDPQGNASTGLGINPRSLEASMYDVLLHDVPMEDAIEAAEVRNLFVAPANLDLAGAEIELVPAFSREMRLKNAIASVAEDFDIVLIDCPPSLGLLTVNAFAAATEVLVPIQCEYYALEGLGQLLRNIDLVKRNLNAALELSAIVLVMYDARTNLAAQVADEVREHFGSKVCRSVIPRNIRLSEAPSFGQPITVFDPSSRGSIAYRDLAKEVAGEPS